MQSDELHINLPFTPFPMKSERSFREMRTEMLQKWRAMDIYRTILEDKRDAESFVLQMGRLMRLATSTSESASIRS